MKYGLEFTRKSTDYVYAEVEADSEEEARTKAQAMLENYYGDENGDDVELPEGVPSLNDSDWDLDGGTNFEITAVVPKT